MLITVAAVSLGFLSLQDAPAVPSLGDLGAAVWTTLADEDMDGLSTFAEWESLWAWCGAGAGDPATRRFEAEVFMQGIDQDALRDWTDNDVIASFEVLDANGDGVIERRELRGERLTGQMPTLQRGFVRRTARLMLVETADRDVDGNVSAVERAATISDWKAAPDKSEIVRRWVDASKAREPENRNAMSPGVTMHTLVAGVDPDANGILDWPQFEAWFRARDANGDGALDAAEIRIQRPVEGSWRRITDERRALPPLMPWQRNLDDALTIQKRTGQPLLICANIDGETACDSLAYWRYRDPAFAALAGGFICLVVSPDDHQPRDHDDRGRRMVSPRLGAVTDAEHIDLEPLLYERFFNGRRVAPRHVGVAVDGSILFDIFLTNDASRVGEMLAEHGVAAPRLEFASMVMADLLTYPDAAARVEREARMLGGSADERLVMLRGPHAGADLAMLGLRGGDAIVRAEALKLLTRDVARLSSEQLRLFVRTVASASEEEWGPALDALDWLGRSDPNARRVADAWIGAVRPSRIGLLSIWTAAARLGSAPESAPDRETALGNLEAVSELLAASPGLEGGALLHATALYQVAEALLAEGQDPTDAYSDAIKAARAVGLREAARAQAIIACSSHGMGDFDTAFGAAHRALPELVASQADPLVVHTLRALLGSSIRRVYAALSAREPFRSSDVADALLAGHTLIAHPGGTEADATQLLTLLDQVGDVVATPGVLEAALDRYPTSADLHGRVRGQVLASNGAAGMAAYYDQLRRRVSDRSLWPALTWYEGLAELVAADWDVQQSDTVGALGHYDASLAAFEKAIEDAPGFADSADHYRVLALAGAASLEAEAGETTAAAGRLVACAGLRPDSLTSKDGLGRTPLERATVLIGAMDESTAAAVVAAFAAASHPLD